MWLYKTKINPVFDHLKKEPLLNVVQVYALDCLLYVLRHRVKSEKAIQG